VLCLFESSDLVAGGSIPEGVDTFSVTIFLGIWGGVCIIYVLYVHT
jgi:hypothetical protein